MLVIFVVSLYVCVMDDWDYCSCHILRTIIFACKIVNGAVYKPEIFTLTCVIIVSGTEEEEGLLLKVSIRSNCTF